MPRPDFSEYVAHFTKAAAPYGVEYHPNDESLKLIAKKGARERLYSILQQRTIEATPMPYTKLPAVAFTECPWGSLVHHAAAYSRFGVGFHKRTLFGKGGGPVMYLRQDLYEKQKTAGGFATDLWAFLHPLVPQYAGNEHVQQYWQNKPFPNDYTHEREWRVVGTFSFEYEDVSFVVVASHDDLAAIPAEVRAALDGKPIITMDTYGAIQELWPL